MSRALAARSLLAALSLGVSACGNTSEPVLERIVPRAPPAFTHRVDVFLVSTVAGCAIGSACADADSERCFFVASESGPSYFEPESLEFTSVGDPRVDAAPQSACFQLDLDLEAQQSAVDSFRELRSAIFQASKGNVDLDLRVHVVAPDKAEFKSWGGGGIFLQPTSLSAVLRPIRSTAWSPARPSPIRPVA